MKKKNFDLSLISLIAVFAMAIVMVIEEVAVYFSYYSPLDMLWETGTPTVIGGVVYILTAAAMLFSLALALSVKGTSEKEKSQTSEKGLLPLLVRVTSAIVALFFLLSFFAQFFAPEGDHLYEIFNKLGNEYTESVAAFHLLTVILSLPTAAYFILEALGRKRHFVFRFVPAVWFALFALRTYFDMTLMLDNPRRNFSVVVILAIMFALVSEMRITIKPNCRSSYVFFTSLALILASAYSIPSLILNITGFFEDGFSLIYSLIELAFVLYLALKLIAFFKGCEKEAPAEVKDGENNSENNSQDAESPETEADSTSKPSEVPSEEANTETEENTSFQTNSDDLTEAEFTRFYNAVYATVVSQNSFDENSGEDVKKARLCTKELISAILEGEDRNENIRQIRAFIKKSEEKENA